MIKRPNTKAQRIKRHKRVRSKISGTPERPVNTSSPTLAFPKYVAVLYIRSTQSG